MILHLLNTSKFIAISGLSLIAVLLLGIYISAQVFLQNAQPTDFPYLIVIAILCLGSVGLALSRQTRFFLLSLLALIFVFIFYTCIKTGAWKVVPGYLLIMAAAGTCGSFLMRDQSGNPHKLQYFSLSVVLGMGILMFLGMLLGLMHGLFQWLTIVLLILVIFLTHRTWYNLHKVTFTQLKDLLRKNNTKHQLRILIIAICVFIFLNWFWAISPALRYDAQSYHLSAPKIYVENHGLVEIEESIQTYWSHYVAMLYSFAILLGGQPLPSFLLLTAGIFCSLLIYSTCQRIWNTNVAIIASLLWLSIPIVSIESSTSYIDIFIVLFISASILSLVIWQKDNSTKHLLLSGIFSGFALGIKISTIPILISIGMLLAIISAAQKNISLFMKVLLIWSLPVFLLAAPWFVITWVWTGNPIFPNYNDLFQSAKWVETSFFTSEVSRIVQSKFIWLPVNLVVNSKLFYHEAPGGVLSAISLLAIPWFLSAFPKIYRVITLVAISFVIISFFGFGTSALNARYFLPVYPVLCALGAQNISYLYSKKMPEVLKSILVILFIIYLFSSWIPTIVRYWEIPERFPLRYAFGLESKEQLINRAIPEFQIYKYLERQNEHGNILGIGSEARLYLNNKVYGSLFSLPGQLMKRATRIHDVHLLMGKYEIEYVLVHQVALEGAPQYYAIPLLDWSFFRDHCWVKFASKSVFICKYQVTPILPLVPGNLLSNPHFTQRNPQGDYVNWQLVVNKNESVDGNESAVWLHSQYPPENYRYVYQDVPVEGDLLYSVFYEAKGISGEGNLQLQVEWFDKNMRSIGYEQSWQKLSKNWKLYGLYMVSPSESSTARIYAAITSVSDAPATAIADNICFSMENNCLYFYPSIK